MKRTLALTLVFAAAASVFAAPPATAEGRRLLDTWISALGSNTPSKIVNLYRSDAVLLATFAQKPITDRYTRINYFTGLMKNPNLTARVDTLSTFQSRDMLVNTGTYTFSYTKDGKTVEVPARFTFAYERVNGNWRIVEHHSSVIPPATN